MRIAISAGEIASFCAPFACASPDVNAAIFCVEI
jgi:hypothetical protein